MEENWSQQEFRKYQRRKAYADRKKIKAGISDHVRGNVQNAESADGHTRTRTHTHADSERLLKSSSEETFVAGGKSAEKRGDSRGPKPTALNALDVLEAVPIDSAMRSSDFIEAWTAWIEYRLEAGRLYRWVTTIRCFKRTMILCQRIGVKRATQAIDRSIMLGYRGVFEDANQKADEYGPRKTRSLNPRDCL